MYCISLCTMHQQHSSNHVVIATAESTDRTDIIHSQETPIGHSQPGVEIPHCWAWCGRHRWVYREILSFCFCLLLLWLWTTVCFFYWWGPCYVEHECLYSCCSIVVGSRSFLKNHPWRKNAGFYGQMQFKRIWPEFHSTKEKSKSLDPRFPCTDVSKASRQQGSSCMSQED